jgi:hypothetical protein
MNERHLVIIKTPRGFSGVVLDRAGRGLYRAPNLRNMEGWPLERILKYCRGKGWEVEVVPLKESQ